MNLKALSDLQLSAYLVEKSKKRDEYKHKIEKALKMLDNINKEIKIAEEEQENRKYGLTGEQMKL
ncbi:MAG: hypothetical protein LBV03_00725 [Fusobacteriales bacterium]|jgi:hypothetical protein|nr:hypothetical protein [Fusobacteriales bacterium]